MPYMKIHNFQQELSFVACHNWICRVEVGEILKPSLEAAAGVRSPIDANELGFCRF